MMKSMRNYGGGKSPGTGAPFWSSRNRREARLPVFDPNQILFDHACETMPDSLTRRRLMLQALKVKIHPRHPAYAKVCAQLAALESITELQAQLQAELQKPLKTSFVRFGKGDAR